MSTALKTVSVAALMVLGLLLSSTVSAGKYSGDGPRQEEGYGKGGPIGMGPAALSVGCSASCTSGTVTYSCSANGAGATCTANANRTVVTCTDGTNTTTCTCAGANLGCR